MNWWRIILGILAGVAAYVAPNYIPYREATHTIAIVALLAVGAVLVVSGLTSSSSR
jgi:hypothetical protein